MPRKRPTVNPAVASRALKLADEIVTGKHPTIMDAAKATGLYTPQQLDAPACNVVYRDRNHPLARARIEAAYETAGLSIERRAELARRNAEQEEDLRASNEALKLVAMHRHEFPDPRLKVDIGGEVKHMHLHAVLPPSQLQDTLAAMRQDLAALPGPTVDAEAVEVEEAPEGHG